MIRAVGYVLATVQRKCQLLDQERIAAAKLPGILLRSLGDRSIGAAVEQSGRRTAGQWIQPFGGRVPANDETARDLMGPQRPRAQRRDQRHRESGEPPREERHQVERVLVGPMEVVEGEEQRPRPSRLDPIDHSEIRC